MRYTAVRAALLDLKRRSNLEKGVAPHLFRKSSASALATMGLTTFEIKKRFGWKQSSRMLDTYLHLGDKQVNDKILGEKGIKQSTPEEEKKIKGVEPMDCCWCGKRNPAGEEYCILCKRPLEQNLMVTVVDKITDDNIEKFFKENPEVFNEIMKSCVSSLREKVLREIKDKD